MTASIESFVQAMKMHLSTPKADLEKNIRTLLNEMVTKMELVSQQELAQQKTALEQANLRLIALQQQLSQLEERISKQG